MAHKNKHGNVLVPTKSTRLLRDLRCESGCQDRGHLWPEARQALCGAGPGNSSNFAALDAALTLVFAWLALAVLVAQCMSAPVSPGAACGNSVFPCSCSSTQGQAQSNALVPGSSRKNCAKSNCLLVSFFQHRCPGFHT